jgi:hypothetical protein
MLQACRDGKPAEEDSGENGPSDMRGVPTCVPGDNMREVCDCGPEHDRHILGKALSAAGLHPTLRTKCSQRTAPAPAPATNAADPAREGRHEEQRGGESGGRRRNEFPLWHGRSHWRSAGTPVVFLRPRAVRPPPPPPPALMLALSTRRRAG